MDGKVDAQPLYQTGVRIGGHVRDALYIATEHGSVYSLDANTGVILWKVTTLGVGETTSDTRGCGQVTPEIGITGTPVIDRSIGSQGTLYLVAMTKDASGNYYQRVHALDISSGAEEFGGPVTVQATYPGTGTNSSNGQVVFDPKQYKARPGLLLMNGIVYTSWGSHCDINPYSGWLIGYNERTLQQMNVFNLAPNGEEAALWNSGGAPAADPEDHIFVSVANGTFDTTLTTRGFPAGGDYGNAFVKLSVDGITHQITPVDYWTMYNSDSESSQDTDLGSGGIMLLPDQVDSSGVIHHLAVGAGKDSNLYVVNRDNMGKYDATNDGTIYQQLSGALPGGIWGNPAYFNGHVYFGPIGSPLYSFDISSAKLGSPSNTAHSFPYPGVTPSISANGNTNGILWAVENASPAVLHAYDALNLSTELYNSNQATGNRDQMGPGNKFTTATIANGQVFVGTTKSVAAYGLIPQTPVAGRAYTIANQFSTLVLDDPGASTSSGTAILQSNPTSAAEQKWTFASAASGYYTITNVASGLLLTDPNGSTSSGASLVQMPATGEDAQLWKVTPSSAGFLLTNKATGLLIDNGVASSKAGSGIELKTADSYSTQVWLIF